MKKLKLCIYIILAILLFSSFGNALIFNTSISMDVRCILDRESDDSVRKFDCTDISGSQAFVSRGTLNTYVSHYTMVMYADMSTIDGMSVSDATLYMRQYDDYNLPVNYYASLFKMNDTWNETDLPVKTDCDVNTVYSADAFPIYSGSFVSLPRWVTANMTDLVRGWANGDFPNYGFMVWDIHDEAGGTSYHGNYYGQDATYNPYIVVTYTIPNSAPTTTSLTISPTTIYTDTDTNISVNYTDSDSDNGTVYFRCYVNNVNVYNKTISNVVTGTFPSFIFDSGNYSKTDKINCSVYANDGTVNGTTTWSNVYTVQNSAPTITSISLTSGANNYTNENLTATPSGISDLDSDNYEIAYQWFNGNTLNATSMFTDGLVAWLPLSNDVKDYSSINDGTLNGYTINYGTFENGVSIVNDSMVFDGDNDYIVFDNPSSFELLTSFSFSFWIYPRESGRRQDLFSKSENCYIASLDANMEPNIWVHDTSYHHLTSISPIPLNEWSFITYVYDRNNGIYKIYINSVEKATMDSSSFGDLTSNGGALTLGCKRLSASDTYNFNGSIKHARIWNKALTQSEIAAEMDSGLPVEGDGLVGSWEGDVYNSTTVSDTNWRVKGKIDGAVRFDGINDYIIINQFSLDLNIDYSYSLWFKGNQIPVANTMIFSTPLSRGADVNVEGLTGKIFLFGYYNTSASQLIWKSSVGLIDGTWHNIAFTKQGTSGKVYLDGALTSSPTLYSATFNSLRDTIIGSTSTSNYFNGSVDDVQIYNRSLSAQEIKQLYLGSLHSSNTNSIINSSETTKGETWSCNATVYDSENVGNTVSSNSLTVLNSPPTTPTALSGFPVHLFTGNTLTLTASGSSDLDGDSITYYYKFYNVDDSTIVQDWSTSNSYTIQTSDAHNTIRIYTKAVTSDANSSEYSEDDVVENSNPEVTLSLPYDTDHNNVQKQDYSFTFSDADGDVNNCTLWINGSLEGTNLTVTSSTSITSTSTLSDGSYSWHIRCDDGNGGINTTSDFTYIIDTVFPNINPFTPKYDNSTIINQNFQSMNLNITGTDTYLFATKVDIINSTGQSQWQRNATGLTTTTYTFNDTIDMSAWNEGTYRANISFSDDHTAKKIKPYFVEKKANGLKYITTKGTEINIDSADKSSEIDYVNTTKLKDRYTFDFGYKKLKSQVSYYLNSNEKIYYRQNLYAFPSFVSGSNWIDFNMNDTESYSVVKITDYQYLITIAVKKIKKNKFKFHSIGGLNIQNEIYSFKVQTNDAPVISSQNIVPSPAYTNSTLTCNVTTTDDENDSVNVAYIWYDDGAVLTGQTSSVLSLSSLGTNYKGHTITCQAKPSDPWQDGIATNTSIVISNWVPVISPNTMNNIFVLDNGESWNFDFNVTEIDSGDTITWSDNTPYFAINTSSGVIHFTSNETNIGDHPIIINASDGTAMDSVSFHLVVLNTTLQSVTYSAPSTYNVNDSITAYQNLSIKNPSTSLTATGLDYTFATPGSWGATSSEVFSNVNVSASQEKNLRLNLSQTPGTETRYTPIYSNGVGLSGYEEFEYDVTVHIASNDVSSSIIRYDIPLDRFPASYSSRNVNMDTGEVDGNSTGVNIENSHYIDVLTTHSGSYSLRIGTYTFTYKYYVYAGAPSYAGGGGGGGDVPYSLVTPISNDSCNMHILASTTIITPEKQSIQIRIRNIDNISEVPSIEWLDPANGTISAKNKMEVASEIKAILPGKEEEVVLRYLGPFGNQTEKAIFRVYSADKTCYDEVTITIQPQKKFNAMDWLNKKIRTIHIPKTDKTFTFTNWFFVTMFSIIAIFVAIAVPVNIPAKVVMFSLINIILVGIYAVIMNFLVK